MVLDAPLAAGMDQLHRLLRASQDRLLRESALQRMFGAVLQRHMQVHDQTQAAAPRAWSWRGKCWPTPSTRTCRCRRWRKRPSSPWQLCRQFRQHFGLPPVAWRNQLRVNRARQLLAQGQTPGAVALSPSFADQAHLTRAFRHTVGLAPAAYQRALGLRR